MHERQPDVARERLLDARVVVLRRVAGIEKAECGHVTAPLGTGTGLPRGQDLHLACVRLPAHRPPHLPVPDFSGPASRVARTGAARTARGRSANLPCMTTGRSPSGHHRITAVRASA
ncbi:hypothetical protein STTU_2247 [Streptomyces sp. Tu6071]|nr:hypothetical protein STTU_2247 [Streptomyces sp. Tu6071]